MLNATVDPATGKVVLTITQTILLDKALTVAVLNEVEDAIRKQAAKDLKTNPKVKAAIAQAATEHLLKLVENKLSLEPPATQVIKEVIREVPVPSSPVVQQHTDYANVAEHAATLPASAQRIVDEAAETFAPKAAGTAKPNPADYVARATAPPARRYSEGIIE
jgi:hypothetical protein